MDVGTRVHKVKGYRWPGVVVAKFKTLSGAERLVVECTVPEVAGALHIYNREQLEAIIRSAAVSTGTEVHLP